MEIEDILRRLDGIETHFNRRFDIIEAELGHIRSDLYQFYRELGRHDNRLDKLEGQRGDS